MIDIFKRWFSHSKEQDIDDSQNPWAGLASYEDPETAERKLKFCGRDDDSYDLARLIMGNVFVTLYGKSGIGKTSLLNAGVFPELREEQYTPVSIRLGIRDEEHPQSYQTMIVEAVERVVKRSETINVIAEQQDQQSIDFLWNYFARHRFYDKYDEPTTPVIVFDQFEEVFRGYRDEAETLLRQLDYLNDKDHTLDSCQVDGQNYRYDQNYRFVVSIREDDLYRLEDSIDNCYLPALKRCRYRLRSLSEEGARDAILIPGEGLFKVGEQKDIANIIINIARNKEDQSISTNLLSLICSRIYVNFKKSDANDITPTLIDAFIKDNPFERFYVEATRGFSDREKSYIENNLVDSTGRRNSVPESDFYLHVINGSKLLEGHTRILQRVSTSSDGGQYRIELIHDSFCISIEQKKKSREKKERIKKMLLFSSISFFAIISILIGLVSNNIIHKNEIIELQNTHLISQYDIIHKNMRTLLEQRNELIEQKDTIYRLNEQLNQRMDFLQRTNITIQNLNNSLISRNRTIESQRDSLAHQLRTIERQQEEIKRKDMLLDSLGYVRNASGSPDGKKMVSTSDNDIKIWDITTKQCIKVLKGHRGSVESVSFSPDSRYIVSASTDRTIKIWDSGIGICTGTLRGHTGGVSIAVFSPDMKRIISASNDCTIRIWNAQTQECTHILQGHTSSVSCVSLSPDARFIVSGGHDKTIRVWDVSTEALLCRLEGHTSYISSVSYSPDGKYIVSSSWDKTIRVWDAITGSQLGNPLEGHSSQVNTASFSPNGYYIVSGSDDKTVRVWDFKTGECLFVKEHSGSVISAYFTPDGRKVISVTYDKGAKVWSVFPSE